MGGAGRDSQETNKWYSVCGQIALHISGRILVCAPDLQSDLCQVYQNFSSQDSSY